MKTRHNPGSPMPGPDVGQTVKSLLFHAGRSAEDFLFPALCIVCRGTRSPGNPWLCDCCASRLVQNHERRDACPLCSQDRRARSCACEYAWDFPFEKIYSLFDFDDTVKELAHEFKYGGFKRLAFALGMAHARFIPREFLDGMEILVPVPLHFFRRCKRGYNQAEYFARGIAASGDGRLALCTRALKRRKATRTQTALSKEQRTKNLASAFCVPQKKAHLVKNKSVILVDDIVTTGATTGQCAEALLAAGATKVRVLSFARD
jgi:ComF family protein